MKNTHYTSLSIGIGLVGVMFIANMLNSRMVFLGQTGMWGIGSWHSILMTSAALAALWLWVRTGTKWTAISTVLAIVIDIAWHITNPINAPYVHLVNPGYLLLNIAAIMTIWQIGKQFRRPQHTYLSGVLLIIPSIMCWNIFVSHSPLTAVYAELYGGGDTLIGQGSSSMFLFVATWSGFWAWVRLKNAPFGVFTISSTLLALSQIAIKGEWRFLAVVIVAALIVEVIHARWPQWWHLNSVLWVLCFGGGYFVTLALTTSIAWPTTIWSGILTIMLLISYAIARITTPYHTSTGATR